MYKDFENHFKSKVCYGYSHFQKEILKPLLGSKISRRRERTRVSVDGIAVWLRDVVGPAAAETVVCTERVLSPPRFPVARTTAVRRTIQ